MSTRCSDGSHPILSLLTILSLTLHSHCTQAHTHTALTLPSHCPHTLLSHYSHTALTLLSHCTNTALTLRSHRLRRRSLSAQQLRRNLRSRRRWPHSRPIRLPVGASRASAAPRRLLRTVAAQFQVSGSVYLSTQVGGSSGAEGVPKGVV